MASSKPLRVLDTDNNTFDNANDKIYDSDNFLIPTSRPKKAGKRDYTVIIHYPGLNENHFQPLHDHHTIVPTTRLSVFDTLIKTFRINVFEMEALDDDTITLVKTICNFLNKNKTSVAYHNALRDKCAMFKGEHLHIAYHSHSRKPPYSYMYMPLPDTTIWRMILTQAKAVGGYARVEAIRTLERVLHHDMCPPRQYMGTNCLDYLTIVRNTVLATGCKDPTRFEPNTLQPTLGQTPSMAYHKVTHTRPIRPGSKSTIQSTLAPVTVATTSSGSTTKRVYTEEEARRPTPYPGETVVQWFQRVATQRKKDNLRKRKWEEATLDFDADDEEVLENVEEENKKKKKKTEEFDNQLPPFSDPSGLQFWPNYFGNDDDDDRLVE